ncbi:adhesion G-protein coupled receptor g6 [Plakobranchus ocellatus]|uniref:Adhesion G-protein coupled receptor g6 n=1 Tax=Plakobranchus ocellatus TaxID=259542 RepID=A0AAV4A782_9GAST|nr:adhesion G-protein coupled receptor g6 [Plakobranchus ocellatus]
MFGLNQNLPCIFAVLLFLPLVAKLESNLNLSDPCTEDDDCPDTGSASVSQPANELDQGTNGQSASMSGSQEKPVDPRGQIFSLEFCKAFCFSNTRFVKETVYGFCSDSGVKCFPCKCRAGCEIYGTCCTYVNRSDVDEKGDISTIDLLSLQQQQIQNFPQNMTCVLSDTESDTHYLMIGSCDKRYSDDQNHQWCEQDTAIEDQTVETYLHVSDKLTKRTYRNTFCSKCNGVHEAESWSLVIDCMHYMRVYMATSEDELLQLSLASASACSVGQSPPDQSYLAPCEPIWFNDVISQCNVTGLWEVHNPLPESECDRPGPITNRVVIHRSDLFQGKPVLFNNIFCAYCNLGRVQFEVPCSTTPRNPQNSLDSEEEEEEEKPNLPRLPFSLLLGFKEPKVSIEYFTLTAAAGNCSVTEWESPDGDCQPLECSQGKITSVDKCTTAMDEIRGLGYSVNLYLTTQESAKHPLNKHRQVLGVQKLNTVCSEAVRFLFNKLPIEGYDIKLSPLNTHINESTGTDCSNIENNNCNEKECFVFAYIIANRTLGRDYFEQVVIEQLTGNFTVIDSKSNSMTVAHYIMPSVNGEEINDRCRQGEDWRKPKVLKWQKIIEDDKRSEIWEDKKLFLPLTGILNCRSVSFNSSRFKIEKKNDFVSKIVLSFENAEITVSDPAQLSGVAIDKGGTLRVCRYLLDENINWHRFTRLSYDYPFDRTLSFWQSLLTLICLGASITCLTATVITYALFGSLRTPAGWNNLMLALSLLLAQSLLLASTYVNGPSAVCTALGVATHFTWLSMFCWSFTCCFYMFRVFTAKTRSSGQSSAGAKRLNLIKAMAMSTGAPTLVVTAVMVASHISTDGKHIGYGKRSCYLDSALLVGVATTLPLGLVTVCNTIFFACATVKIYNIRKLQSSDAVKKENAKNLFIYIRLSTLTGVCWLVALLAEAIDNDPLRFIYIILNGLQGVFIFLSYICNKRVLVLYTSKEMGKKYPSSALFLATSTTGTASPRSVATINTTD